MRVVTYTYQFTAIVTTIVVTMFFSCKDNYADVQKTSLSENEPIGVAENLDLSYTVSGNVEAILKSPKRLDYSNRIFPFEEYPQGMHLELFEKENEKIEIISDYAIIYNETNLIDLQGNVRVTTSKQDTLFAEQLYYDQKKDWIFTNQPISFKQGSDIINGTGFDADSKFENATVLEIGGSKINVKDSSL